MAYENNVYSMSLPALTDYSTEATFQFTGVKVDPSTGKAAVATSGDLILGVMQNNPLADEAAAIMVHGISKCLAAGAITAGDSICCSTGGGFALATSGLQIVGIALESAAPGDIFTALLKNGGKV